MTDTAPTLPKGRRAGRRPSKEFDEDLADMVDSSDNEVLKNDIKAKLALAKEAVAKGDIPEPKRSAPARSYSSDSYQDYHKSVFDEH